MAYHEKKHRNVTQIIVPNDLCIGCGLCAGICPPQVLNMEFNLYGEYIPIEYRDGCLPKCDLCLQACPFWDQADNEDTLSQQTFGEIKEIKHTSETGYYEHAFACYSKSETQRHYAASGGVTTWLLQMLLEKDMVDRVITVKPNNDPEQLFQFTVWDTEQGVQQSAGSVYYPVEMSKVIQEVLRHEARYVIVGLPCYLKAIRLAARRNRRLRRRVIFLLGLVCGQTKSSFYAEYLCAASGGDPKLLDRVRFRVKDYGDPSASNFQIAFDYQTLPGRASTSLQRHGPPAIAWSRGWFKPNACNYCDDVFAEVADVSFMDAWLDRYMQDNRGTNFVLVRNPQLRTILEQGQQAGRLFLEKIPITDVIESQQSVLDMKREHLAERLAYAQRHGLPVPPKRIAPRRISIWRDLELWIDRRISLASKSVWSACRTTNDLVKFERKMRQLHFQKKVLQYIIIRMLPKSRGAS